MSSVSSMFGSVAVQSHAEPALTQADHASNATAFAEGGAAQSLLSSGEKAVLMSLSDTFAANGLAGLAEGVAAAGLLSAYANPANGGSFLGGAYPSFASSVASQVATAFGSLLGGFAQRAADVIGGALTQDAATGLLESCRDSQRGLMGAVDQLFGAPNDANIDRVENAIANTDLSRLSSAQRSTFLAMVGFATADGHVSRAEANALVNYLHMASGATGTQWTVNQSGDQAHIDLGNYTLDLNKADSSFVLTNKATGETTRIWGDPHFEINGQQIGMFKGPMTLNLDDGTKITIYPKSSTDGKNVSYTNQLVITRGDRALGVTGLDQQTGDPLNIAQTPVGGRLIDLLAPDGTEVYENAGGQGASSWLELQGFSLQSISSESLTAI